MQFGVFVKKSGEFVPFIYWVETLTAEEVLDAIFSSKGQRETDMRLLKLLSQRVRDVRKFQPYVQRVIDRDMKVIKSFLFGRDAFEKFQVDVLPEQRSRVESFLKKVESRDEDVVKYVVKGEVHLSPELREKYEEFCVNGEEVFEFLRDNCFKARLPVPKFEYNEQDVVSFVVPNYLRRVFSLRRSVKRVMLFTSVGYIGLDVAMLVGEEITVFCEELLQS